MAASKNQKGKRGTTGKTAKSTASRRKTTAKKQNVTSGFQTEIILLIILAASMILVISNFGLGGAVGDQRGLLWDYGTSGLCISRTAFCGCCLFDVQQKKSSRVQKNTGSPCVFSFSVWLCTAFNRGISSGYGIYGLL